MQRNALVIQEFDVHVYMTLVADSKTHFCMGLNSKMCIRFCFKIDTRLEVVGKEENESSNFMKSYSLSLYCL